MHGATLTLWMIMAARERDAETRLTAPALRDESFPLGRGEAGGVVSAGFEQTLRVSVTRAARCSYPGF